MSDESDSFHVITRLSRSSQYIVPQSLLACITKSTEGLSSWSSGESKLNIPDDLAKLKASLYGTSPPEQNVRVVY